MAIQTQTFSERKRNDPKEERVCSVCARAYVVLKRSPIKGAPTCKPCNGRLRGAENKGKKRSSFTDNPTLEELKKHITYCPDTGEIFNLRMNATAGYVNRQGYLRVRVQTRIYSAHRLAWFWMTGSFPPATKEIDHIDGNPLNNKWSNLRLVSRGENCRNFKCHRQGKIPNLKPYKDRWDVKLMHDGQVYFRRLPTKDEALCYLAELKERLNA